MAHKPVILSGEVIAALAYKAGVTDPKQLRWAVAICYAESSGNVYAEHHNADGSIDRGLWQINSVHSQYSPKQLFNPGYNAVAMYAISSHGTNWSPWSTYPVLASAKMVQAQAAISKMNSAGGADKVLIDNANQIPGASTSDNFWGNIPNPVNAVTKPIDAVGQSLSSVAGFLGKATDPHVWFRIGEAIAGAILLIVAIIIFTKQSGLAPKVVPVPV